MGIFKVVIDNFSFVFLLLGVIEKVIWDINVFYIFFNLFVYS